jgi:cytosine/adenosine deaminase-related metal-dependent hydrolase
MIAVPPKPSRLLLRNGTILTLAGGDEIIDRGDILVENGRIAGIGTVAEPVAASCERIIDVSGKLVVPGFANSHLHSPATLCPGTVDAVSHPIFMWLNQADSAARTPREVYVSVMLGCLQMLLTGTTAVIDHFPEQNFSAADVEAAVKAYEDSGMRAVVALRIWDGEYGDIFPDPAKAPPALMAKLRAMSPLNPQPLAQTMELVADCITRWNDRAGRIGIFPGPSNPSRCSDALMTACQDLAERHDVGIHVHLLETKAQDRIARETYGCSMVEHLDRIGVLTHRLSCAHSNWVTEDDMARMARVGAVAVHNPESNLKFATGIAPIRAMKRLGVPVALGTDGASHNDNLILHNVLQIVAILHRWGETDRSQWIVARDALRMATEGGARAMLLQGEIGSIAIGKRADLVVYDLSAPWWIPFNDPVQQLVHAENGSSVDTVLVDGRVVVEGRRPTLFDGEAIKEEAKSMLGEIRRRNAALSNVVHELEAVL